MDKAKDQVQEASNENQNAASSAIGSGSQHPHVPVVNTENKAAHIGTAQRCPDQQSVQNNASSEVATTLDPSKSNQQDESNKSQPHLQNNTKKGSTTEVDPNPKKAKQRLRKGKWTIEEEEYTSRIIQYFSTGLLTLPDGATLRSYLAEKLNCDPMRITKKFTGACCLGRRAYHLRDRPRASPAEIEMASFELLHLEQRFRLRVEHEQTGLPLPPRHELLASQPTPAATVVPSLFTLQQGASTAKATNHWIQNPVLAPSQAHASLLPGLTGLIPNAALQNPNTNLNLQNSSSLLLAAGQLLLQNQSARTQASNSSPAAATAPLQMLNNLVASYALSRAITQQQAGLSILQAPGSSPAPLSSTTPKETIPTPSPSSVGTLNFNVSDIPTETTKKAPQPSTVQSQDQFTKSFQLHLPQQHDKSNSSTETPQISKKEEHTKKLKAAFEEQQKALRIAYEKSLRDAQEWEEKTSSSKKTQVASDPKGTKPTSDAKTTSNNNSKASLETISPAEQLQRSYEAHLKSLQRAEQQASLKALATSSSTTSSQNEVSQTKNAGTEASEKTGPKKSQDEEEGAILLGFLNSLRESFKDAIEDKDGKHDTKEGTIPNIKRSTTDRNAPEAGPTPSVQLGSSRGTSDGSESIIHIAKSRSGNERLDNSMKSRRQTSDPITSLSHFQSSKRKVKPASITETSSSTSSQPTSEQPSSSQEDSKSDKMGSSSSEDSDKEITASIRSSKGPPRKRLKGIHEPHEFTRENLMAHSKRMDMECGQSSDVSSSDD